MNVTLIGAPAEQVLSLMKRKENDKSKLLEIKMIMLKQEILLLVVIFL